MTRTSRPDRPVQCGEVWQVVFDPVVGHEQGGTRPALVVSGEHFNQLPHGLCVVAPITTRNRGISTHVPVDIPEGGLKTASVVMCDQLRTISIDRLQFRRGAIGEDSLTKVRTVIQRVFDL